MKKTKALIISTVVTFILTGCCMSHEWKESTCTEPKTCTKCGETEGEALGHTWAEATCSSPKTCTVCGETEGKTLAHIWVDATCSTPKTCSVCGETAGEALGHMMTEANYQQPATCEVCGETVGAPLTAYFEAEGLTCDAELDIPYPYTVLCYDNQDYTTTGKVIFSDYKTFASDETHEAIEGYEWQTVTVTRVFDDDNANEYGFLSDIGTRDYYLGDVDSEIEYTLNYNGKDYDKCTTEYELLQNSGWVKQSYTLVYRFTMRVPEGYDGCVAFVSDGDVNNAIFYRLK